MTKLSFVEMVLGRYLPTFMRYILVVSSISLAALIFAQVWLRYVFQLPLLWVEEVAITPCVLDVHDRSCVCSIRPVSHQSWCC